MERNSIDLGGGCRLAVMDDRNWKLQHWHEPDASNPKTTIVLERRMRDEGEPDESLRDAMERVGVIRDELMAAVA